MKLPRFARKHPVIAGAACGVLLYAALSCACGFKPQKYALCNLYPDIGFVKYCNPNNRETSVETTTGDICYTSPEFAEVGDVVCVIMHTNGTETLDDDYPIKVTDAAGWDTLLQTIRQWYVDTPRRQGCG